MKPTETNPHTRRALFLVDFQKDFLSDGGRMPVARSQVKPMITAAKRAAETARSQGDAVIFIGNEFRPTDYLMNFIRRNASIKGSPGSIWDERLPLNASDYFPKWATSAFVNPALEARLKAAGVNEIVLAGLKTSACISATALDALRKGYRVALLSEATADSTDRSRERALRRLASRGIELRSEYPTLAHSGAEPEMSRKFDIQKSETASCEARRASTPICAGGLN